MGCPSICMGTHSEWPWGESGEEAGLLWEGKLLSSAFKEGKDVIAEAARTSEQKEGLEKGTQQSAGSSEPGHHSCPPGPMLASPPPFTSPPHLALPHFRVR